MQLVQMRLIHTLLTCYYNLAGEGGTQDAIFIVCYHGNHTLQANIEWAKVAYSPVKWNFAIMNCAE